MLGLFRRRRSSTQSPSSGGAVTPKDKWRQKYAQYFLGTVTHYYSKIKVGIVQIENGELQVGDIIYVRGKTTFFKQRVASIEYNHRKVRRVGKGYDVGIRMPVKVREQDDVYLMPPNSA